MTNSQRLAIVRAHLCAWIANETSDCSSDITPIHSESIVIRDGHFCGRSFVTSEHRAIWFIEEDELKIQDIGGAVVAVFTKDEISALPEESTAADDQFQPHVIKLDLDQVNEIEPTAQDDMGDEHEIRRAA